MAKSGFEPMLIFPEFMLYLPFLDDGFVLCKLKNAVLTIYLTFSLHKLCPLIKPSFDQKLEKCLLISWSIRLLWEKQSVIWVDYPVPSFAFLTF